MPAKGGKGLVIVLLLGCLPAAARADEGVRVAAGARIRITSGASAERVTGTLVALDDEAVTVQVRRQAPSRRVHRSDITALEVSTGRRSRGRNALIGGAIGAGLGIVAGRAAGGDTYADAAAASVGFLLLTGTGVVVGAAIPPGERWTSVPPDRVRRAAHGDQTRRIGLRFALAF